MRRADRRFVTRRRSRRYTCMPSRGSGPLLGHQAGR
jgi:hypothetical protein